MPPFVLTLLLSIVCHTNFAQNASIDSLKARFVQYQTNNLKEKVYLHTDKDLYLVSEIIWFKAYLVDDFFNRPSLISKVAYVEIIDQNNSPVLQAIIPIKDGFGNGSFQILNNLNSGSYTIRAYTNWMKNFGSESFFSKSITIINHNIPPKALVIDKIGEKKNDLIPETENLVNNIENNESAEGFVVKLDALKNNEIQVSLQVPPNNYKNQEIYLLINTKGVLKNILTGKILNDKLLFNISKNILGDGISQFTFFDNKLKAICQRFYFKYPEKQLDISLNLEKTEFKTREKITVNITTKDPKNQPKLANLSMAVYLIDSLQKIDETNILSNLLVTNDFNNTLNLSQISGAETRENIEAVFNREMVNHDQYSIFWSGNQQYTNIKKKFIPEYAGQIITGKITNGTTNKPIINEKSFLTIPSKNTLFYTSISDSLGIVRFELDNIYDKKELIVQTDKKDSAVNFEIFSPFSDQFSKKENKNITNFKYPKYDLESHIKYSTIQSNYSLKQLNNFQIEKTDSLPFYYKPDYTYLLDNYVRFTTLEEILKEFVPSVGVKKRDETYQLQVVDKLRTGFFEEDPMVLLDGLPIFDINKLMKLDPLKIEKLEVVSGKYFYGNMTFAGIVNFTTYHGDLAEYELETNTMAVDYSGFQPKREFYSPNYDSKIQKESRLPDFRNLLYWNPNINTLNGEANLEFFSSDVPGKYVVVVQGMANDGSLGAKINIVTVN